MRAGIVGYVIVGGRFESDSFLIVKASVIYYTVFCRFIF